MRIGQNKGKVEIAIVCNIDIGTMNVWKAIGTMGKYLAMRPRAFEFSDSEAWAAGLGAATVDILAVFPRSGWIIVRFYRIN